MNGKTLVDLIYPAGSIYISVNNTNPEVLFPGTTWVAFGAGRTLVGINSSDTDFDTVEETGGSKTKTLADTNIPAHIHHVSAKTSIGTAKSTVIQARFNGGYDGTSGYNSFSYDGYSGASNSGGSIAYLSGSGHTHSVDINEFNTDSTGTGTAFNIMNPYITVYMWKRTA